MNWGLVMLKKAGPQYIVDEGRGVSLEATGPYSFLYTNNQNSVEISSEPLKSEDEEYSVCVYISSLETWDKPEQRAITPEEIATIKEDVQDALRILELNVEFE